MAVFDFMGFSVARPINRMANGVCALAVNVRAYLKGAFTFRNLLTVSFISGLPTPFHTLRRLNDSTPNGPASGYTLIIGAGTSLYAWNSTIGLVLVATGLSGNPLSMIPFRPNTSVQPWMYVFDSAPAGNVTIITKFLINGTSTNYVSRGAIKVRSDGLAYVIGAKEPQLAPIVSTQNSSTGTTGTLLAKAIPWTNYNTENSSYNYGEIYGFPYTGPTPPVDGTARNVINCKNASFITINSITGTATVNGNAAATPTTSGPVTNTYPAYFIMAIGTGTTPPVSATIITGCFTDGAGNVVPAGVAPLWIPSVVDVGAVIGVTNGITVPYGAQTFQIGIDSAGNSFHSNSGSFAISVTVTTNALPPVTATIGALTAYYWGDSPTSGPVASYIWKNPGDSGGSGPTRSTTDAVGSTTGNSFIFDASFGASCVPAQPAGIPGLPGRDISGGTDVTANPMLWTELNPQSVATGANSVFAAPIIKTYPNNTQFVNFNFCLTGNIYFPSAGHFTFVLTSKDDVIWGIGGGVTLVSATSTFNGGATTPIISDHGQTITVASGLPLLPRTPFTSGVGAKVGVSTIVVNVPAAGIYPIELDFDYWFHSGRILLLMASPTAGAGATIIPPLTGGGASASSAGIKEQVQYCYVYRSDATGATSNPSPSSAAETVPVISNAITSFWSPDPQVNWVDLYRSDSTTDDFTYVNTGPNDNSGGGTNTPVLDSLSDTELGTKILDYSNFEPFPSIDLPQQGICNVSSGIITWVSGGAVGGTQQGFNVRWLAGTTILIGSPTSLAYVMIARPTPASFQNAYIYPLGFVILDSNSHYQKVTVTGVSQGAGTPSWSITGGTTVSGGVTFLDMSTTFNGNGYVTQITIPGVPDGNNLAYQIDEPTLAAQPLPYDWGPSDNIPFICGCGDTLRPGTMYWSAGSNLDAAPDTNQQDLTDPSEALVNGVMTGGRGIVFTIKRAIAVMPNFMNALATVTGTQGSTWSVETSGIDRGLFIPRCLTVDGSGLLFFRVDDGIHVSQDGLASQSITDETLYPLFSHEGSVPTAITRNGNTVYPPDDTLPQLQKFSIQNAYMYYNYQGTDGNPHTLVYDIAARGWEIDQYQWPVTVHAPNEGQSVQGTLVGCSDGTVRQFSSSGTEAGVTATVLTGAIGGQGWCHLREITVEYSSTVPVTLTAVTADSGNGSYGPAPITLPSTSGALAKLKLSDSPTQNKWKLMWFQFSSTGPFTINVEGFVVKVRSWGEEGEYHEVRPFAGQIEGGE